MTKYTLCIHPLLSTRNTVVLRLVLFLIFSRIFTSAVHYLCLIFFGKNDSLFLIFFLLKHIFVIISWMNKPSTPTASLMLGYIWRAHQWFLDVADTNGSTVHNVLRISTIFCFLKSFCGLVFLQKRGSDCFLSWTKRLVF